MACIRCTWPRIATSICRSCATGSNANGRWRSANAAWTTSSKASTPTRSTHYFEGQLRLAREFDLPVIVHARRAVDAVIAAITQRRRRCAAWCTATPAARNRRGSCGTLGFLLGLGGPVTYDRANRLRQLAATMPLEYLLLETDAPDQPDAGIRGQRNEPARLADGAAR